MSEQIEVRDKRDLGAFIPAALDDYGLTPYEFRIYARLVRRAGKTTAYESVANLASACKMSEQKVKVMLRFLSLAGMVSRHSRPGTSSVYTVEDQRNWAHPEMLDAMRKQASYHPGVGVENTQVLRTPRLCEHPGVENTQGVGVENTQGVGVENTHKGTPMKVLPKGTFSLDPEGTKGKNQPQSKNQPEPVTAQLPTPSSKPKDSDAASSTSLATKSSAAANFSEKEYLHDPTGDRLRNELAPWRTGRGPNDWNEDILAEYVRWADEAFKKKHSRYTAVAFFSNCEMTARRGEMQGASKAVALCEELQQRLSDRAHRIATVAADRGQVPDSESVQDEPETPESLIRRSQRFAALKQQLVDQKARRNA